MLINTQKSISEIAFTFSPSQFSRFFKRYTDTTPTAYRNKRRVVAIKRTINLNKHLMLPGDKEGFPVFTGCHTCNFAE
ncbi:helix-turn-helix domain-containing protein [Pararcticibacter amylolyticus]|uniref:HTH araC/xylS-type domain-containing protein n=1 Tax=Pararcticibacter amylolyticus TaxID=2173175 RepID=A0A2U2PJN5_9SPHI|nr:AraC family transcriptional regulator [Pararcticibacter amylolyticus]PWG81617.1 hypothetical protein DDR33_06060 [Pararcticibacter amylolyticus]